MRRSSVDVFSVIAGIEVAGDVPKKYIPLLLYVIDIYLLAFTEYELSCSWEAQLSPKCVYKAGGEKRLPNEVIRFIRIALSNYNEENILEVLSSRVFTSTPKGGIINKNSLKGEASLLFINGGKI